MTEPSKRFRPKQGEPEELSQEELEAESGEQLPDRQAMSVIDANVAIPANPAVAASVLAGGSAEEAEPPEGEEKVGEGSEEEEPER